MNCDDVALSLPWYLNGSLSAEERSQVSEHLKTCAACRQELADTLWLARAMADHASHQELISLVRDQEMENRKAVERHVEMCPSCREKLQLIELMTSVPEHTVQPVSDQTVAVAPRSRPDAPGVSPWWRLWALAATLILALGSGLWIERGAGSIAPQTTQILVLEKPITIRNTVTSSPKVFEVEATSALITLFYPLSLAEDLSRFDRFTAELRREQEVVLPAIPWQPDQQNSFALTLARADLELGQAYTLNLFGWTGETPTELESLPFSLSAHP